MGSESVEAEGQERWSSSWEKLGPGSKVEWASSFFQLYSDNLSRLRYFKALGPAQRGTGLEAFSDYYSDNLTKLRFFEALGVVNEGVG